MAGFRNDLFGSVPGFSGTTETYSNHVFWGQPQIAVVNGALIDGAARDAGSTPTTLLRTGLLLGMVASTGKLKQYSPTATDGTDLVHSVLLTELRAQDLDGNNVDRFIFLAVGGPVKAANLIGLDEYARAQMADRFLFDDRSYSSNTYGWRGPVAKATAYTVVNGTDNNTIFTTQGAAGAVTFTLPTTILKGQRWRFFNEAGQNMTVAAPAGKLVTFNNAAATSVTFSTAGNLIGGSVEILANADASKYLAIPSGANTLTVA